MCRPKSPSQRPLLQCRYALVESANEKTVPCVRRVHFPVHRRNGPQAAASHKERVIEGEGGEGGIRIGIGRVSPGEPSETSGPRASASSQRRGDCENARHRGHLPRGG